MEVEERPGNEQEQYSALGTDVLPVMTKDPVIGHMLYYQIRGCKSNYKKRVKDDKPVLLLLKEWPKLMIQDGILYRKTQDSQRGIRKQLVLPMKWRTCVKTSLNNDRSFWNRPVSCLGP